MSKYLEKAKELRNNPSFPCNCCQATLLPFAKDCGLSEETAAAVSANFGQGMKRAATCGAITAGLMILGLYGVSDPLTIGEYHKKLKENHNGFLDCADLLRINKEAGLEKKPHCDAMVYECVKLAEDILREKGKIE